MRIEKSRIERLHLLIRQTTQLRLSITEDECKRHSVQETRGVWVGQEKGASGMEVEREAQSVEWRAGAWASATAPAHVPRPRANNWLGIWVITSTSGHVRACVRPRARPTGARKSVRAALPQLNSLLQRQESYYVMQSTATHKVYV